MSQDYGQPVPAPHGARHTRQATQWLVLIASGPITLARLLGPDRVQAAEFDANTEEVAVMVKGLPASIGATAPEWDRALAGHSAAERAAASVYLLDV